jgi:hypothetical protein
MTHQREIQKLVKEIREQLFIFLKKKKEKRKRKTIEWVTLPIFKH